MLAEALKRIGATYQTIEINGEKVGQWTFSAKLQATNIAIAQLKDAVGSENVITDRSVALKKIKSICKKHQVENYTLNNINENNTLNNKNENNRINRETKEDQYFPRIFGKAGKEKEANRTLAKVANDPRRVIGNDGKQNGFSKETFLVYLEVNARQKGTWINFYGQ